MQQTSLTTLFLDSTTVVGLHSSSLEGQTGFSVYNGDRNDQDRTEYLNNIVACNEYFMKLKEKMMKSKIRKTKSFSMSLNCHNVILVSDTLNDRIKVFNATTKQFVTSIHAPSTKPWFLCVQEKYNGSDYDALIFDCTGDKRAYKYDLHGLLLYYTNLGDNSQNHDQQEYPFIWKSTEFLSPQGIAIFDSKKEVYICDKFESISVLDAATGLLKHKINLGVGLSGIFFTNDEHLLLTEWIFFNTKHGFSMYSISPPERCSSNGQPSNHTEDWEPVFELKQTGTMSGEFSYPSTIIFDNTSKHIILGDFGNNRIQFFDIDGNFVTSFGEMGGSASQLHHPEGMCLNEETGELLVVDQYNHRIQIYR
ncbi:hypothetical protein C9374_005580 [Naegleria lovaniensis]|uniref:Uncharacterized protein n=1 Tax=Naegleria lovaniensis TaxID=51637 RepID=A0AA88GQM1_NAELO|nr:uncharacterized protein C9374_005580 [Naegleria lovaniensis]KAG2382378.1 hypothetical protein C9374_005580 [Naegleria lovaniensis]